MKFITNGDDFTELFKDLIKKYNKMSFATAWATKDAPVMGQILENRHKIDKAVIGIHFYQTSPEVLEKFIGDSSVKFKLDTKGVFHPKLYLFWTRKNWELLIGSGNLTHGAFCNNTEAMLHITSADCEENLAVQIKDEIQNWHLEAEVMTEEHAHKYKNLYATRKTNLDILQENIGKKKAKSQKPHFNSKIYSWSWQEFYNNVIKENKKEKGRTEQRCKILEEIHTQIQTNKFSELNPDWRKAIAGIAYGKERFLSLDWGLFGSMVGAGTFKSKINNNNTHISNALDCIPLQGKVEKKEYINFVKEFKLAFPKGRDGIGVASRLLAMKRPDFFCCIDSKNKTTLCNDLEINTIKAQEYEEYWDNLIANLHQTPWFRSERPTDKEELRVWNGRIAMLDAIYYSE